MNARGFIAVAMAVAGLASAPGSAPGETPRTLFTVHCEPSEPPLFAGLGSLVGLAESFGVPLTIEMTPQWADTLIANPAKLATVRAWQANGHEIGIHHHGIYHQFWDFFTNYPPSAIVAQGWSLAQQRGDMNDLAALLEIVAGDSLLLVYGGPGLADPAPEVDWIPGIPYRTSGGRVPSDAFSSPRPVSVGSFSPCQIDYSFIDGQAQVDAIKALYAAMPAPDVVGVVTHVANYLGDPAFVADWMAFVQPTRRMTVRDILRESEAECGAVVAVAGPGALRRGSLRLTVSPNPFYDRIRLDLSIAPARAAEVAVFDTSGRRVRSFGRIAAAVDGTAGVVWDGDDDRGNLVGSGVYVVIASAGEFAGRRVVRLVR